MPDPAGRRSVTPVPDPSPDQERQRAALKRVAAGLREVGLPYALAGGYAAWVRGAPEPEHDVDFLVAEDDVPAVVEGLRAAGLEVVEPPEGWLRKVLTDGVVVDLLHRTNGVPVRREQVEQSEELSVLSVVMPVVTVTHYVCAKLNSLDEHHCDLAALLPQVRALREQVDWPTVREATAHNPFAEAFLLLLRRLEIAPDHDLAGGRNVLPS
jgi:hypothetical protein